MKNSTGFTVKINRAHIFRTPLASISITFGTREVLFFLDIFYWSCIIIYMATDYSYIDENEDKGVFYLKQIVKDGWTVTRTEDYCHYDATITKGNKTFNVENKVRYINQKLADKGLLLDANKVDKDVEYYIEYLPKAGKAYVITYSQIQDGIQNGTITRDTQKCADKTYIDPDNKVKKNNYIIPLQLFKCYPLICQGC